jgi:hypothetical protein
LLAAGPDRQPGSVVAAAVELPRKLLNCPGQLRAPRTVTIN